VADKVACDQGAGEVHLESSPGKVKSLVMCGQMCEARPKCNSITYFKSGYCSHFSTSCAKTQKNGKAVVSYRYGLPPATTTKSPSASKRLWTSAVSNEQCDTRAGEVFLKSSPGKVSSLDKCKHSCEHAGDCRSITYFNSGWCSHFSTSCEKTKTKRKATVLRYIEPPKSFVTRAPFRWDSIGSKVVCDTGKGEAYLNTSPGKIGDLTKCQSLCAANSKCNSITYYKSGYCSHFSTSCTKTKKSNKALVSLRITTARRHLRGY